MSSVYYCECEPSEQQSLLLFNGYTECCLFKTKKVLELKSIVHLWQFYACVVITIGGFDI